MQRRECGSTSANLVHAVAQSADTVAVFHNLLVSGMQLAAVYSVHRGFAELSIGYVSNLLLISVNAVFINISLPVNLQCVSSQAGFPANLHAFVIHHSLTSSYSFKIDVIIQSYCIFLATVFVRLIGNRNVGTTSNGVVLLSKRFNVIQLCLGGYILNNNLPSCRLAFLIHYIHGHLVFSYSVFTSLNVGIHPCSILLQLTKVNCLVICYSSSYATNVPLGVNADNRVAVLQQQVVPFQVNFLVIIADGFDAGQILVQRNLIIRYVVSILSASCYLDITGATHAGGISINLIGCNLAGFRVCYFANSYIGPCLYLSKI